MRMSYSTIQKFHARRPNTDITLIYSKEIKQYKTKYARVELLAAKLLQ